MERNRRSAYRRLSLAGIALAAPLMSPSSALAGTGEYDCRPSGARPCFIKVRIFRLPNAPFCRAEIEKERVTANFRRNRKVVWQIEAQFALPNGTHFKFGPGDAIKLVDPAAFEDPGPEDALRKNFRWRLKEANKGESRYSFHVVGTRDAWVTQNDCDSVDPIIAND